MNRRLNLWKKKLLDTGKRNRLINFKKSLASTIEIDYDDFYKFYEEFNEAPSLEFAKLFLDLDDYGDLDEEDVEHRLANALGKTVYYKDRYTKDEIKEIRKRFKPVKGRHYVYGTTITSRQNSVLNLLKKKSELYYQENGVNALYMCFGFLEYIEEKEPYMAPLVLVPVELSQKSIVDNFKIRAIDEDYSINNNLIHKFKTEYKIDLTPSKEDLSVKDYIAEVSAKVSKLKCEVKYEIHLGLFSFSKIMMYQDINENEEKIKNSNVVKGFVGLSSALNNGKKIIDVDDKESLDEQNQVLYADSSQFKAIKNAKAGLSFVLQGPPGTGKSQTITNMLAELIGQDKKVLFVCEKRSALEVVYRNLKKCGLDQYALPLFDTKANKKDIVKSIYDNLDSIQQNRVKLSKHAIETVMNVKDSKKMLETYISEITKNISPLNTNLYNICQMYSMYKDLPDMSFSIENIFNINEDDFKSYLKSIDDFAQIVSRLGDDPKEHPFYLLNRNKLTISESKEFKNALINSSNKLDDLSKVLSDIRAKLGIEISNFQSFDKAIEFLAATADPINVEEKYLKYKDNNKALENLKKIEELSEKNKMIKAYITSKYKLSFLDIDVETLLPEMQEKYSTKISRMFSYKKVDSYLESYLLKPYDMKYDEEIEDLKKLKNYKENYFKIASIEPYFKDNYSEYYFGTLTDFYELKRIIGYLTILENASDCIVFNDSLNKYLDDLKDISNQSYLEIALSKIKDSYKGAISSLVDLNLYFDYDLTKENPLIVYRKIKEAIYSFDRVYEYIDFIKGYQKIDNRISSFKKEVLQIGLKSNDYIGAFKKRFAEIFLDQYLAKNSKLDIFNDTYMKKLMDIYKREDDKTLDISKVRIRQNVTESWPQLDSVMSSNLEVKTLLTEANKKRKLKSLRILFNEIPNILIDLKPIFMMSPLSVATYLSPDLFHFDCVIFDEASQITTENAIGAMYRADQVIIVGDNEQLPPTSFFDGMEDEDEGEEEYDIYESILDEALTSLPKIMLKWHYRSKDESLIAFSNQEIYHDLTTFPGHEKSASLGVKYFYCENAMYVHGKRVNPVEAKKVVDIVLSIAKNSPDKSLGIVTFNMAQQSYIDRLIRKERIKDSSYEEFFSDDKLESFFVKNLETVQGDERDIIIISTTFGKDDKDKISMNFGPINKEGGYRRLNVAITRAKEEVILVSSLQPGDFKIDRLNNRGVKMLHDYIEFADKSNKGQLFTNNTNDGIALRIKSYLEAKGFKVLTNLGASSYKIDLAVVNPKNEEDLVLAIIVDGQNYQGLKTIRDRNHLMDNILELRGWNIYHVWSLSFVKNEKNILSEIEAIIINGLKEEINPSNILDEDYSQQNTSNDVKLENLFNLYPDVKTIIANEMNTNHDISTMLDNILYEVCPIKIDDFKKLVLPLYKKSRLTPEASNQIDSDMNILFKKKRYEKVIGFILRPSDLYGVKFRRINMDLYYPKIDGVFVEELEDAFISILRCVKTTSKSLIYSQINTLCGYASGSVQTKPYFDKILDVLCDKGEITLLKDIIELKE